MREEDRQWMEYIDAEVRAVCREKGWGSQIRRKWSAREQPVSRSPIEDYEWKLIPGASGALDEVGPNDFDGVYYVLSVDPRGLTFLLQHDTNHVGVWGPHWEQARYTRIGPPRELYFAKTEGEPGPSLLAAGWLQKHLLDLVSRTGPNHFSRT